MIQRSGRMARLVVAHLLDNRAAFFVSSGQTGKMPLQMTPHLAFGLSQKTQVPFVAEQACRGTDGK